MEVAPRARTLVRMPDLFDLLHLVGLALGALGVAVLVCGLLVTLLLEHTRA